MEECDLLLINPPFHMRNGGGNIFPLGLGYIISSAENSGYSVKVINGTDIITSFFEEDLLRYQVSLIQLLSGIKVNFLIGIGPCMTTQIKALKIIANCCKKLFPHIYVVGGGPLASIDGQEWVFFDYLDIQYIIKGDGELAIVEVLKRIQAGLHISCCSQVCSKNNLKKQLNEIEQLDQVPYPRRYDRDSISYRRAIKNIGSDSNEKITASMITSRGCVNNCFYCVSGNIKFKQFRKRNISNIIDEMVFLHDYGISDIVFYDDCFFYNPHTSDDDVSMFCNALISRGIALTWQIEVRTDLLASLSNNSIHLLEKSGCRQINIGIEKTNNESLKKLGKTCSFEDTKNACYQLKLISPNIILAGTFILGGPGETRNDIISTVDDSLHLGLDYAHYNPLFIYPCTPLYSLVFENDKEWFEYIMKDNYPWGEIVYQNDQVDREVLLDLVEDAYRRFYSSKENESKRDILQNMINDRFNLKRSHGIEKTL